MSGLGVAPSALGCAPIPPAEIMSALLPESAKKFSLNIAIRPAKSSSALYPVFENDAAIRPGGFSGRKVKPRVVSLRRIPLLKGYSLRFSTTIPALLCISSLLLSTLAAAQSNTTPSQGAAAASKQQTFAPPSRNTLLDGTPVKLRLAETVSSANAKAGQQVPFEVVEDVQLEGVTVIPKGAPALGTVTDAAHRKSMGRGGKLDLKVDSVRLLDNEKVQLRAAAGGKGGGHTAAMTIGIVSAGILFFPAAPLFLFIHGKDITLPKGLETTAFVEGDRRVDLTAFSAPGETSRAAMAGSLSQVSVDASVPDCDIRVDGAFSGNTPSQLALPAGKHEITVHKQGYEDWTRTLATSGPAIHLHAELQPEATAK